MNDFKERFSPTLAFLFAAFLLGGLAGCGSGSDGSDGIDGTDGTDGADGNSGPVIANISTVGSPIYPGGQVQIFVSADSPSGESLSFAWDIPDGWSGQDDGQDQLVLTAPDAQADQATVSVQVSDGDETRTASVQVTTRGPVVENFSVDPLPEAADDEASFSVDAYNRDGHVMKYHYVIGGIGFDDRGAEWDWTATQAIGGRFLLQAIVEDGNGLSAGASMETTLEGVSHWPGAGGNRQRTGLSSSPDALGAIDNDIWSFTAGNAVTSSPAIGADGTVYVGSGKHLYAVNADGDESGSFEFDEGTSHNYASPAIGADGTVYIGSQDYNLYALTPDGDEELWHFVTDGAVESSPAIGADGTIYVGSLDNNIYAVTPDGTEQWRFLTDGWVHSSPTIGPDGTIYVGSYDNNVYALNPDGTEQWRFPTGDEVRSSPAIGADGTIYVGSHDNNLYALNPDGTEQWRFPTDDRVYSSPAIAADGTIYVGSHDENLYALSPDGTEQWRFPAGGMVLSSPAIGADGTIYVGSGSSGDGNLYALNPDGTKRWSFPADDYMSSSPAIGADGTVYIGSSDGKLYAIR